MPKKARGRPKKVITNDTAASTEKKLLGNDSKEQMNGELEIKMNGDKFDANLPTDKSKRGRQPKNKSNNDGNILKDLKVRLKRDESIDKLLEEEQKAAKEDKNNSKKPAVKGKRARTESDDDLAEDTKPAKISKHIVTKGGKNNEDSKKTVKGKRARSQSTDDLTEGAKPSKSSKEVKSKGQGKGNKMPDVTLMDFSNTSKSQSGKSWNLKLSSWNVNGIRAWLEKDGLAYIKHEDPDILCIQETKCSEDKLPKEVNVAGYSTYWLAGDKDGYSGVGLLSKEKPISVKYGIGIDDHDNEGRVITAEYKTFYLVTAYVPNAGRGLVRLDYRMKWDKDFCSYLKDLDKKKPVILCGDLNVAHEEIDLANPKTNKKSAGFTIEEREGFSTLLSEGFVDSFRHLYPDEKGAYTFWTYMMNARAKNVGWRLDYFVMSKKFSENLCDCVIRKDVMGSDHCPITLFLAM